MSAENVPEKKAKKSGFMSEEARLEIQDSLEKIGIKTAEMSDEELIKKINQVMNEEIEKRVKAEASKAITPLNAYAVDTKLKDKEFIERLYNMNVPRIFLSIFTDEDSKLENKEIWEKIRMSNIRQIDDVHEIYKERTPRIIRVS